jgi:hypothetical protein
MRRELIIRPSMNDHEVVADLLAPGGTSIMVGRQQPVISRLVVDAHVVARRPQFAEAAAEAGIPFLVDPWTPFLQGELREADPWAALPYGTAERVEAAQYSSGSRDFVRRVVDFELEHEATAVVAPYPYVTEPTDEWFGVALRWLEETRAYLDEERIGLPLIGVMCGQLLKFGAERTWAEGLNRFAAKMRRVQAHGVALCLSPIGNGKESYNKLLRFFLTADRLQRLARMPTFAWQQGMYGPALVAAGLDGYATGIGISEQTNISSNLAARRPPKNGEQPGRGGSAGVFLDPLGKSLNRRAATALLSDPTMRAKLMCTDERCCPNGITSTMEHPREHAVRTRQRELLTLDGLPARAWRLNHIATQAQAGLTLAHQANKVLVKAGVDVQLGTTGFESLARVAEELRHAESEGRVA